MAREPYSGTPTVEPAPAPSDDYQRIDATPGAFGGVAAGAEQRAGTETQHGAGDLAQAAIVQQDRFNQVANTQAVNEYQHRALNITGGDPTKPGDTGYFGKQGADAVYGYNDAAGALDNMRTQIRDNLQNDAQRVLFDNDSRRYQWATMETMRSHYDQQFKEFSAGQNDAAVAISARNAAQYYNDDSKFLASAGDAVQAGVRAAQDRYGDSHDANITNAAISNALTPIVKARVEAWAVRDPAGAANWLENGTMPNPDPSQPPGMVPVKSVINPNVYSELSRQTKNGSDGAAVAGGINSVIQRGPGPQITGTPAPIDDATRARAQAVHDTAVSQGASDAEGWGWAANAVHESGAMTAPPPGDGGISHGMFQLNKDQLAKYQATHGGHLPEQDDLGTQLAFARSQAAPNIVGATGPGGYASAISSGFEVPANGQTEAANRAATANFLAGGATQPSAPGTPGSQPSTPGSPSIHTPQAYGYEQQMMDQARAEGQRLFPNNPARARQVEEGVWQHIQETNLLQAKAESETLKAHKDAEEAAGQQVMTSLRQNPAQFNPSVIWNNPSLDWETKQKLSEVANYQLTQLGIDKAPHGPGYSDVFAGIVANPDAPNAIHSMKDIWSRAGQGGDLTLHDADTLSQIFTKVHKDPDEAGVRITESAMMEYAKGILWKPSEMGGIKDQDGLNIYNGRFVPAFISGFEAWQKAHPDNPLGYLNKDNLDKIIAPLKRNPTQEANDRLAETGQLGPGDVEKPGTPLPPPPTFPAGVPPIAPAAWQSVMTGQLPIASNGSPYTHAAWATYLTKLMQNPTPKTIQYFDQHFGVQGFSGADIVQRLRAPTPQASAPLPQWVP